MNSSSLFFFTGFLLLFHGSCGTAFAQKRTPTNQLLFTHYFKGTTTTPQKRQIYSALYRRRCFTLTPKYKAYTSILQFKHKKLLKTNWIYQPERATIQEIIFLKPSAEERVHYFYQLLKMLPEIILNLAPATSVFIEESAFSAHKEKMAFIDLLNGFPEWKSHTNLTVGEKSWLLASKPPPQAGQTSLASL